MKENKSVLYIIYLDKFTKAFVSFLKNEFTEIKSKFIIYGKKEQFKFDADKNDTIFIDSYHKMHKGLLAYNWAVSADIIVFSGLFSGSEKMLLWLPKGTIKKTYFHFWGGDFYDLKETKNFSLKTRISIQLKKHYIRNVKGVINLIPGDYDKLCQVCLPKGEHYVAPVSDDGLQARLIEKIRCPKKNKDVISIMVGNSATESNQHSEAFKMLEKFKNENIKIICPLSYGDTSYAETIIKLGKSIFKDKFLALTDYMDMEDYFHILSKVDVAVFNNNRQQAMGNINSALGLGSKVYLRSDTSMWQTYSNERRYTVFKTEDISNLSFSELYSFSEEDKEHNFSRYSEVSGLKCRVDAWNTFFDATLK